MDSTVQKPKNAVEIEVPQGLKNIPMGQTKLPIFGQAQGQILMKQQALQGQKPATSKSTDEKQPGSPKQNGSQNASKLTTNNTK